MADTAMSPGVGAVTLTGVAVPALMALVDSYNAGRAFRTAAVVTEQWFRSGRCRVYGIYPEVATTAGTITIRDSGGLGNAELVTVLPVATLAAGRTFGPKGLVMNRGLSIQLSNAADLTLVDWEAI